MMAGVVAFVLLVLLAGLAWLASHDRGPNPRETFDPSTRQRIDAMRDAEGALCCCREHGGRVCAGCVVHADEGEALDHICAHCASPPWADTWMHDCRASCCAGGGAL